MKWQKLIPFQCSLNGFTIYRFYVFFLKHNNWKNVLTVFFCAKNLYGIFSYRSYLTGYFIMLASGISWVWFQRWQNKLRREVVLSFPFLTECILHINIQPSPKFILCDINNTLSSFISGTWDIYWNSLRSENARVTFSIYSTFIVSSTKQWL